MKTKHTARKGTSLLPSIRPVQPSQLLKNFNQPKIMNYSKPVENFRTELNISSSNDSMANNFDETSNHSNTASISIKNENLNKHDDSKREIESVKSFGIIKKLNKRKKKKLYKANLKIENLKINEERVVQSNQGNDLTKELESNNLRLINELKQTYIENAKRNKQLNLKIYDLEKLNANSLKKLDILSAELAKSNAENILLKSRLTKYENNFQQTLKCLNLINHQACSPSFIESMLKLEEEIKTDSSDSIKQEVEKKYNLANDLLTNGSQSIIDDYNCDEDADERVLVIDI